MKGFFTIFFLFAFGVGLFADTLEERYSKQLGGSRIAIAEVKDPAVFSKRIQVTALGMEMIVRPSDLPEWVPILPQWVPTHVLSIALIERSLSGDVVKDTIHQYYFIEGKLRLVKETISSATSERMSWLTPKTTRYAIGNRRHRTAKEKEFERRAAELLDNVERHRFEFKLPRL